MKRNISIFLSVLLCLAVFLPVVTQAEAYTLSGTDMTISLDDDHWFVFTRDNIENNPELERLGSSYTQMHDTLYNNNAYMDAVRQYGENAYMEFIIQKFDDTTDVGNMSNYDDEKVKDVAEKIAKEHSIEQYDLYKSQYKFVRIDYFENIRGGVYICEFATIVNKDTYSMEFQSQTQFTDEMYAEMERIVNSIIFNVDPSIKEPMSDVAAKAIGGAVAGGLVGGITALVRKRKKKREENNEQTPVDPAQMQ